MSSDDEVLSGGPASENEAVDVAVTAGATPPGPFGAPRSALAENIQRKGASNRRVWVGLCACPPFTRCCCVGSNSYFYARGNAGEGARPQLRRRGALRFDGRRNRRLLAPSVCVHSAYVHVWMLMSMCMCVCDVGVFLCACM